MRSRHGSPMACGAASRSTSACEYSRKVGAAKSTSAALRHAWLRSLHSHADGVPALGTIGKYRDLVARLHGSGRIGGTDGDRVLAGGGLPAVDPLPPRVSGDRGGKLHRLPWPVVDAHLHDGDPPVLRPRHPGDDHLAFAHLRVAARDVDA